LRPIQFAYNTRVHTTNGFSPFFMVTGSQARLPSDVIAGLPTASLRYDDDMPFSTALAEMYAEVRDRLELSAVGRKGRYDLKHLDVTFDADATVMVYSEEAQRKGESSKFLSKWIGPFRVLEQVNPVTYRLEHLRTGRSIIAHVNRLRKVEPYVPPPDARLATPAVETVLDALDFSSDPGVLPKQKYPTPVASSVDHRPSYDMESIHYKRVNGDLVEYLVKFQGYDELEWIREEDIDGADMIAEFERRYPSLAEPKAKSKRSARNRVNQRIRRRASSPVRDTAVPPQNLRRSSRPHARSLALCGIWSPPSSGGKRNRVGARL
jgi:hypothetical protein